MEHVLIIDEYSIPDCLPGWYLCQTLINHADAGGSINGGYKVDLLYLLVTVLLRDHVSLVPPPALETTSISAEQHHWRPRSNGPSFATAASAYCLLTLLVLCATLLLGSPSNLSNIFVLMYFHYQDNSLAPVYQ